MTDSYGIGFWKAIKFEWETFKNRTCFNVGNGGRVKFQKDKWCVKNSLEVSFPKLFSIVATKETWVVKMWE